MRTLARAVGSKDIGGEPLPTVFRTFEVNKVVFRRAEISMIAGTPGAGKSSVALAIALKAKVPTLYVSADTNAHTMAMRLLSMITGKTQSDVEILLETEVATSRKVINEHAQHIFWSFDSSPTLDDLDQEVAAFEELWGCPPVLIIVDNITGFILTLGVLIIYFRVYSEEIKKKNELEVKLTNNIKHSLKKILEGLS